MRTLTAAGRTFQIHTRADWQDPKKPVTGPLPYPDLIHTVVAHWPGAASTWKPDTDVAAHLRRGQASYLATKGFSYGYSYVIGPNPVNWSASQPVLDVWEVRGIDIRNASNNGDFKPYSDLKNPNWNGYTNSIQVMCSDSYPPTADQQLAFRYMLAWLDTVYGERLELQGHKVSDSTGCPGSAMMAMMPALAVRPSPPPPPTTGSYTVVAGDSWYAIARKLSVTPQALVAANPPATMATILHPGDVLKVPGAGPPPPKWYPSEPQTTDGWIALGSTLPTPPPGLEHGENNPDSTWWQAVMCAMPKLEDGQPIYNPNLIAYDRIGSGAPTRGLYGDASKAACAYWQAKNGLTADGVFGPQTQERMRAVRGK